MPSEMIPEDDRLALARALRNVQGEPGSDDPDEVRDDIARLFDDEVEERTPEKPARRFPRVKLLHALLGLLVVACLALAVPLALDFFGGSGQEEIRTIQAEPQPEKVRPEEPGGLEVPYQDKLVMNQGDVSDEDAPVERLLPPPESPQPITAETAEPAVQGQEQAAAVPGVVMPEPTTPDTGGTADAPNLGTAQGGMAAPEPIQAPAEEASPLTTGPAASPARPVQPEPIVTPEVSPVAQAPESAGEPEPGPSVEALAPAAQPAAPTAAAASGDSFFIQLGSLGKVDAVSSEWARLQKAFPDLLGDMNLVVQTVTLEDRGTFHRIQTGPFPNRGTAEDMCSLVKAGNQACLVVKR